MIFGLKVGLSLGGALVGFMLDNFDYDVSLVTQTLATQEGIKLSMSFFAGIPFFIASGLMLFYCINKQMENDIEDYLITKRKDLGVDITFDENLTIK